MFLSVLHICRVLQALFAIIIMGLDAYVANWYNTSESLISCPGAIAFLIFASVYTILIIVPYTVIAPRYFGKLANKWAMLSAEMTTMLFWFGGLVASADLIRNLDVCRGSVCSSAIAGTVLGAFEFVLFGATTCFALRHIFGTSSTSSPGKDSTRSGKMKRWFGREKYAEQI